MAKLDKARPESEGNWPAEDYDTIVARLDAGISEIAETEAAKGSGNVLIVSHGLSIMALLKHLFGDDMPEATGVANASATVIEYKDGEYTLKSFTTLLSLIRARNNGTSPEVLLTLPREGESHAAYHLPRR